MKKYLAIILSALMCLNQIPAFAESGDFTLRVEEGITAAPGEKVEVDLIFENNPGLVALTLAMDYGKAKMKLVDVKDGGILGIGVFGNDYSKVPFKFAWANLPDKNFTENGALVTLTFEILEDATPGKAHIATRANNYNIINKDLEEVPLTFVNGYVQVVAADGEGTDLPAEPEAKEEAFEMNFADVAETDWFYNAVANSAKNGWMYGISETEFAPNGTLTRGMLVSILYRIQGSPEFVAPETAFEDVADGEWYADGVNWAAANGLVSGIGDGLFAPNDNLTKEQMFKIVYDYAKMTGMETSVEAAESAYADAADVADWAKEAAAWAEANGLISLDGSELILPQNDATRAQVSAVLSELIK